MLLYVATTVLFVQYLARMRNWQMRPSYFLEKIAEQTAIFWNYAGQKFAQISSYLYFLRLNELVLALGDLISPIWKTLWAGLDFFKGYKNYISNLHYADFIILGSIVLIISLVAIAIFMVGLVPIFETVKDLPILVLVLIGTFVVWLIINTL